MKLSPSFLGRRPARRRRRWRQRICLRAGCFRDLAASDRAGALRRAGHELWRAAAQQHAVATARTCRHQPLVAVCRRRPRRRSDRRPVACPYRCGCFENCARPVPDGVWNLCAAGAEAACGHRRRPCCRYRDRLHRWNSGRPGWLFRGVCRRFGRNCAAGRRRWPAPSISPT